MTSPLLVLAVPLLDVVLAIVRRFLRGQPIFGADRDHIHHRLLSRGYAPHHVVLLIYGICSIGATISLLSTFLPRDLSRICDCAGSSGRVAWVAASWV